MDADKERERELKRRGADRKTKKAQEEPEKCYYCACHMVCLEGGERERVMFSCLLVLAVSILTPSADGRRQFAGQQDHERSAAHRSAD